MVRYADDFVMGFKSKKDAERVLEVLGKRLAKYGLELRACNVRATHEKARGERSVGYVKQNFLAGYTPTSLCEINLAVP